MADPVHMFKALADPTRLRILRTLTSGPFHVNELVSILGAGQSTISRHLRLLAEAGLVTCRRTKTWAFYSLPTVASELSGRLLEALEDEWRESPHPDRPAIDAAVGRRRDATAAFFRRRATEWDQIRDELLGPSDHVSRLVSLLEGTGTLVDLGTGTGVLLERLAPHVDRLIGIDASPEMLELARHRTSSSPLQNSDLRLGTLEHLPLSDGEADGMIANLVLHHVAQLEPVLREMRRGLTAGGRLVIVELTDAADEAFWQSLGAQWPGFRIDDLCSLVERSGFRISRVEEPVGTLRAAQVTTAASNGHRAHPFLIEAVRLETVPSSTPTGARSGASTN